MCTYVLYVLHSVVNTTLVLILQNVQLQQENAELRQNLQSVQEQAEAVQQAIRDRDEAIAKWEADSFFSIFFNANH